jgi:DNA-binding winged helix-turn-helix (wHTH) protein
VSFSIPYQSLIIDGRGLTLRLRRRTVQRFGEFELDEGRRELRLRGREVVLQPRVFDLLEFLIRNRDRVVTKDELLQALWPGVIVADGAVHRAVSLARSALQQGSMEKAIRTQARVGYRFCAEVVDVDATELREVPEALVAARSSFDADDWEGACARFAAADDQTALEAADLERWSNALQFSGRMQDAIAPLERAVAAHAGAGDCRGAARAALQLANLELEGRKESVARGWRNRAASMLKGQDESREHGFLAWLTSRLAIFSGDMSEAEAQAKRAVEIGRRLDDPELEALGLNYQGLTYLARGEIARGVPLQDEAATAALSGQAGPWAGGMIFCAVIWGCVNRGDWRRANEWTEQFNRWVERQGVAPFPGLCRLHRAEVLTLRGELVEAERELLALRDVLSTSAPYAEGDLYRVLGELRMARGDLETADEAFRRAYELGWDPQPGHALLQVRQGKAPQALRALERCLEGRGWATMQRRTVLLAHLVVVAVAACELERARTALAELEAGSDAWSSPAVEALVHRARGELAFAEGRRAEAIAALRRAADLWRQVGSPLTVGSLRIRLAELLRADGDPETAELELAAAKSVFRRLGLPVGESYGGGR